MSLFDSRQRKAKIVCTIGPSSTSEETITALIKNGMNVARLNFSHGDHQTHKTSVELIRHVSKRFDSPVAILQDLQGVKIRVGRIQGGAVTLKKRRNTFPDARRGYRRSRAHIYFVWRTVEGCREG